MEPTYRMEIPSVEPSAALQALMQPLMKPLLCPWRGDLLLKITLPVVITSTRGISVLGSLFLLHLLLFPPPLPPYIQIERKVGHNSQGWSDSKNFLGILTQTWASTHTHTSLLFYRSLEMILSAVILNGEQKEGKRSYINWTYTTNYRIMETS